MADPTTPRLSPSRMNDFLGCEYRTWTRHRARARPDRARRGAARPTPSCILERGPQARAPVPRGARGGRRGRAPAGVRRPAPSRPRLTEEAMRAGREVIHQACFLHDGWVGYADFLVRVDEPSATRRWSYEVHDAKLGRATRSRTTSSSCSSTPTRSSASRDAPAADAPDPRRRRAPAVRPGGVRRLRGAGPRALPRAPRRARRRRRARLSLPGRRLRLLPVVEALRGPAPRPTTTSRSSRCSQRRQGLQLEAHGVHTVGGRRGAAGRTRRSPRARRARRSTACASRPTCRSAAAACRPAARAARARARPRARTPARAVARAMCSSTSRATRTGATRASSTSSAPSSATRRRVALLAAVGARRAPRRRRAFEEWMDWITARLAAHPDLHVFHYNHYEPTRSSG